MSDDMRALLAAALVRTPQKGPLAAAWDRDMILPFARRTGPAPSTNPADWQSSADVMRGLDGNGWQFAAPQMAVDLAKTITEVGNSTLSQPYAIDDANREHLVDAAGAAVGPQMAAGMMASPRGAVGSSGGRVTMYHGTTREGADGIRRSGYIDEPAFFSDRKQNASMYGDEVLESAVPKEKLMIDADLPGAKLLTIEEANGYFNNHGWTIDDYLSAGRYSFGINERAPIIK